MWEFVRTGRFSFRARVKIKASTINFFERFVLNPDAISMKLAGPKKNDDSIYACVRYIPICSIPRQIDQVNTVGISQISVNRSLMN